MNAKLDEFMRDPEQQRLFEQESLAFEATELISSLMEQQGIKKAELARRIGKSKAFVTQLLGGSRNMTIHTFADLAFALGYRVQLSTVPANRARTATARRPQAPAIKRGGHSPYRIDRTPAAARTSRTKPERVRT